MFCETGVKLEQVATVEEEVTFTVTLNGRALGNVTLATYYKPVSKTLGSYVAVWSGPLLCVVDRQHATLRCTRRRDETHQIHQFNDSWIIEGELSVDMFKPTTLESFASYAHDEVITESWLAGERICIRDFQDRTLCLNPSEGLRPMASAS